MPESLDLANLSAEQLEVWREVEHLWELSLQRDVRQIRESLHPEYVGWDTNAPQPHNRDAAVHSVTAYAPLLISRTLYPLSVRVYEGSVGVAHYRYKATVRGANADEVHVTGKWTEVYVKRGSRWLMVAVSGRPSAEPAVPGGESVQLKRYAS